MNPTPRAIFLSYASQDADAARRICDALRADGLEVWFDQSELRGGDAWDAKIRQQIRECALLVPIISATTQARHEGYFRLEWHLAEQRSHLIARGRPFIVPVAIDATGDAEALVPDAFLAVQWMRLPGGAATPAFTARIRALLEPPAAKEPLRPPTPPRELPQGATPPRRKISFFGWLVILVLGGFALLIAGVVAVVAFRPKRSADDVAKQLAAARSSAEAVTPAEAKAPASQARQLATRARALFERLDSTRDDFGLAEEWLKQALATGATDAEVCAADSQLNTQYLARGFDGGTARREAARAMARRAVRLDPSSFEARFAELGLLDNAGAEARMKEEGLRALQRERPADHRVLRALSAVCARQHRLAEAIQLNAEAAALPGGDPLALYNSAWDYWFANRPAEADAALQASLAQGPFASSRVTAAYFDLLLRGDFGSARNELSQIPPATLQEDRPAVIAFLVEYWGRNTDAALARLNAVPRDWIDDNFYRGPKARMAGDVLAAGGRRDAARLQWTAALQAIEARLADAPNEQSLFIQKALLLADLGRVEEAATTLRTWEQTTGAVYTAASPMPPFVLHVYLALGRNAAVVEQLGYHFAGRIALPSHLTWARLQYDPTFDSLRDDPAFQSLVARVKAAGWPPPGPTPSPPSSGAAAPSAPAMRRDPLPSA